MELLVIDLDLGGRHFLQVCRAQIKLCKRMGSRRSLLHEAFHQHLKFVVDDGQVLSLDNTDQIPLSEDFREIRIQLGDEILALVDLKGPAPIVLQYHPLSPFESRYLADNGRPYSGIKLTALKAIATATDLHVHFAGCLLPADLIRIGREQQIDYPISVLAELGIHLQGSGEIALDKIPAEFLQSLELALAIPLDRRITFVDMEKIYRVRRPITKSLRAFVPMLRKLASDYAAMGVRYVELSLSNIVEANWLAVAHREVPGIERESGVTLRFLAAFSRHDDLEWDLDLIDRVVAVARSGYIVGADFMGHENNSTRDFARQIRELAVSISKVRPGFTIRVHAGENPAYPENVRTAVEAVDGCDVRLRVGHGLYGVDEATLGLLVQTNTIVEFNLNSNLALNNIQSPVDVPISRYLDRGVAVVLGTDGYGIYQTTTAMEARAAMLCGVTHEQLETIAATEAVYLEHRIISDERATDDPALFKVPADTPNVHYVPEVLDRKAAAIQARDQTLLSRLKSIDVPLLNRAQVSDLLQPKRCISIAGSWNKSWIAMPAEHQESIRVLLAGLVAGLSPEETVFVTGGTSLGVESVAQQLAMARGFTVLGTIVQETPPELLDRGAISHAHVVGESLYSKAAGLYTLVKENHGVCLFIGGGSIVNDEIQTALNLRLSYLLMDGPPGASTQRAREQPQFAFRTATEVLAKLREEKTWGGTHAGYWHSGANPTVDMVVFRQSPDRNIHQVLLILRDADAPTEGGKWALPGGFQLTHAPRGAAWQPDAESAIDAAVRELHEEAGIDLSSLRDGLLHVGIYEHGGRDPRDSPQAWSRSQVFAVKLKGSLAASPLCGADDACDAQWFDLDRVPANLAFDHAKILQDALETMHVSK